MTEQDCQWVSRKCTNLSAQANIQSTCVGYDLQVLKKTTLAYYFLISVFGYVRSPPPNSGVPWNFVRAGGCNKFS